MSQNLLQQTYLCVLAFEKKARASLGTELAVLVSAQKMKYFQSSLINLIGESSDAAKLTYIKLVDEVLAEVEKAFPIEDLNVLWPTLSVTKGEAAFLAKNNCHRLARIANLASRRRPAAGPRANKFKF